MKYLISVFALSLSWVLISFNNSPDFDIYTIDDYSVGEGYGASLNYTQVSSLPLFVVLPHKTSIFKLLAKGSNQNSSIIDSYRDNLMIHFVREVYDSCTYEQLICQNHIEDQSKAINYFYSIKYEFDGLLGKHFKKNNNTILIQDLEDKFLNFKVKKGNPLAQLEDFMIEGLGSYTKNSKFREKQYFGIEEIWNRVTERNKE